MKKQLTEKAVYQPRNGVKITVTNTPHYNEETRNTEYTRKVTLNVDCGISTDKMQFADTDEIADFFGNVDYEEAQQKLL